MKKETLLTAVVFLVVGFFAGDFYQAQRHAPASSSAGLDAGRMAPPPGHPPIDGSAAASLPPGHPPIGNDTATGTGSTAGLPPGHPSIDSSAVIQQLEAVAKQNPNDPQAAVQLANYLYDQRQYAESIAWYQKSIALNPKNVNARTDMGTCYFLLGRPRDALKQYAQSLQIDPTHEPTMFNLIIVNLEGTHDLRAARKAWEKLNARDPGYPGLERLKKALDNAANSSL